VDAVELDRRAQRIAHRAAQETAGEMLQRSPASRLIAFGLHNFFSPFLSPIFLSPIFLSDPHQTEKWKTEKWD
jgi:hypothetical protein